MVRETPLIGFPHETKCPQRCTFRNTRNATTPCPMSMSKCNAMAGKSEPRISTTNVSKLPTMQAARTPCAPW